MTRPDHRRVKSAFPALDRIQRLNASLLWRTVIEPTGKDLDSIFVLWV